MKKKLFTVAAALGAVSLLCGFDSAQTPETILQNMQESISAQGDLSLHTDFHADGDIAVSDNAGNASTVNLNASGTLGVSMFKNPFSAKVDLDADLGMFGMQQQYTVQVWMVPGEGGSLDMYAYSENSATEEGEWAHESQPMDTAALLETAKSAVPGLLTSSGIGYTLSPTAVTINGTECYELTSTIDGSSFSAILEQAAAQTDSDQAQIQTALALFEGLKVNLSCHVDTATYLPVQFHIDLNGSDISALNALIASSMLDSGDASTTAEVVLNDISADIGLTFGNTAAVEVPAEAIAAAAAQ